MLDKQVFEISKCDRPGVLDRRKSVEVRDEAAEECPKSPLGAKTEGELIQDLCTRKKIKRYSLDNITNNNIHYILSLLIEVFIL